MYVECLSKIFFNIKITPASNVTLIRRKEFTYGRSMSADLFYCTKLYGVDITRLFQVGNICSNVTLSQTLFSDQHCHNNDNKKTYIEFLDGRPLKKIASCNKFHLKFQKQFTNLGIVKNFSKSSNGTTYHHNYHNEIVKKQLENVYPTKDGISFCRDDLMRSRYTVTGTIEYYISLIGVTISIMFYVAAIFTSTCFKQQRTVANLNIAGFCSMLLLSDIMFLLSQFSYTNPKYCKAVSVIWHWGLLSVQCWTVIVAIEILVKMKSVRPAYKDLTGVFKIYFAAAIGIPLLVISFLVISDSAGFLNRGYGDNGICWITNLNISLLVSIILLMVVIFKIIQQMKSIEKILSQGTKYRKRVFRIALKLITILGLCEITGVIQIRHCNLSTVEEYVNITFSVLYTFFRSFKGIMLSLVYLFSQ